MQFNSITFVGLGYIGLPTAVLLASKNVSVLGVDINQHVVDTINAGELHIVEPGLGTVLKEVVNNKYLQASTKPKPADAFVIAVPTPFYDDHKPDISYIKAVSEAIAPVITKGNLIILESTSPVGTTEKLEQWLIDLRPDLTFPSQVDAEADISIAYCPERVLPGNVLHELVHNNRTIGGLNDISSQKAEALYKIFVKGNLSHTNARTAEMCKLTENSFRDVNIAFANELSMICDKLNINVWELIELANKHPRVNILQPGCGVGGHCIAVDPWFIVDSAPEEARIIRTAREVNNYKPQWVVEKVKSKITDFLAENPHKTMQDVSCACLGLAFKPDIDDLRESPAVEITADIASLGCKIVAVEPHIQEIPQKLLDRNIGKVTLEEALDMADVMCVLVKHSEFLDLRQKNDCALASYTVDMVNLNR